MNVSSTTEATTTNSTVPYPPLLPPDYYNSLAQRAFEQELPENNSASNSNSTSSVVVVVSQSLDSNIVLVKDDDNATIRLGNIWSLLLGNGDTNVDADQTITMEMSAVLAVLDFNRRFSPYTTQDLFAAAAAAANDYDEMEQCNFYLTFSSTPSTTNYSSQPLELIRDMQERVLFDSSSSSNNNLQNNYLRPMAFLGAISSQDSARVATMGAIATRIPLNGSSSSSYDSFSSEHKMAGATTNSIFGPNPQGIPNISPSATASHLDDQTRFSLFSRTIPPMNVGQGQALLLFLQSIGVDKLAVLYYDDNHYYFGRPYSSIKDMAQEVFGIKVNFYPYGSSPNLSLDNALVRLRQSGLRYVAGVFPPGSFRDICTTLYEYGLLGGGGSSPYAWFFSDSIFGSAALTDDTNDNEIDVMMMDEPLALALNQTAVVSPLAPRREFEIHRQTLLEAVRDEAFQKFWSSLHQNSSRQTQQDEAFDPSPSIYSMLTYDAVTALGLAACQTNNTSLFSGPELYDRLKAVRFAGATGDVFFNRTTGSRDPSGMFYQIRNIRTRRVEKEAGSKTSNAGYYFEIYTVPAIEVQISSRQVITRWNLTMPRTQVAVPPFEINTAETSLAAQVFCWVLAASVILFGIFSVSWTVKNRDRPIVRASQPIFLVLLCVGAILMAVGTLVGTLQEPIPVRILNIGCMTGVWLSSIGFSTIFAALFAKTYRINKVYQNANRCRRVTIRARDVLLPFFLFLGVKIIILIVWTITDPLKWNKIYIVEEGDGPRVTWVGCRAGLDEGRDVTIFAAVVQAVDVIALLILNYESYRARNLPSLFNESLHIAITSFFLLEVYLIAFPVLYVAGSDPTTGLVVNAFADSIVALGAMMPIFISKWGKNEDRRFVDSRNAATDETVD